MLLVVLVLVVLLIVFGFYKIHKIQSKYKHLPGPKPLPLLGNILDLGNPKNLLNNLMGLMTKYGDTIVLWTGPVHNYVFTRDVDILRYIMTSNVHLNKASNYRFLGILGDGLVTSKAQKWKVHRKIIEPAFGFKVFDAFLDIFSKNVNVLLKKLENHGSSNTVDTENFVHLLGLDTIFETSMGYSLDIQMQDKQTKYIDAVEYLLKTSIDRSFSIFKRNDLFFKLMQFHKRFQSSLDYTRQLAKNVIDKKRNEINLTHEKKVKSFIDVLINTGQFTDDEIIDEINTILVTGYETIAQTIAFALHEIARNDKIQASILEEVRSAIGLKELSINDIHNLSYVDRVYKETLRKYTSGTFVQRELAEDINIGGCKLPKGTEISMFLMSLHRDPKHYSEPDCFDPDRFLQDIKPFTYLPFSQGPRNCIGQRYAYLLFKLTIAKVVQNFELSTDQGELHLWTKFVLSTQDGIHIYFKKRSI